jgi:hypothetical protein
MKVDRRTALKMGIATGTLPFGTAILADGSNTRHSNEKLDIYKIIVDEGFARGREFGRASRHYGATVAAVNEDITDIWYHDLDARWKQGPAAIAGLTTVASLFCLQQLARDVNMHVVHRVVHRSSGDTDEVLREAKLIANFPRRDLVQKMPKGNLLPGQQDRRGLDLGLDRDLVSWVIAPLV